MDIDKSLVLNELKKHFNFKKELEFAVFLGIKPQTLASWHSRNVFDIEILYKKCNGISPDWLLTGKGEMLRKNINTNTSITQLEAMADKITIINLQKDKIAELEKQIEELKGIDNQKCG